MSLRKFLTSKTFFFTLATAVVIVIAISLISLKWLSKTTNHGQEIKVPNLEKKKVDDAIRELEKIDLRLVILDTLDFDKSIPPLSIVEQDPAPGNSVKVNRKIYVKVNASGYSKVNMPELSQLTYRQAAATVEAMGLHLGVTSYQSYIGRDVVLQVRQNGKTLKAGDKVLKASKIDFVLGDGRAGLSAEQMDQAPEIENTTEN